MSKSVTCTSNSVHHSTQPASLRRSTAPNTASGSRLVPRHTYLEPLIRFRDLVGRGRLLLEGGQGTGGLLGREVNWMVLVGGVN